MDRNCLKRRSTHGIRDSFIPNETTNKTVHYTSTTDRIRYRVDKIQTPTSESLHLLTDRVWKVCKMTPLNNFSSNDIKLKKYAVQIKQAIVQQIKNETTNVSFKVQITAVAVLEDELDNLYIEVSAHEDKNAIIKYRGFLLFCNNGYDLEADIIHLPLLLDSGAQTFVNIVHNILGKIFDTSIYSVYISQEDLMWITAVLCKVISEETVFNTKFNYTNPNSKKNNSMEIAVEFKNLQKLWKSVHSEDNEEISFDEVVSFNKKLTTQLLVAYGIKFNLLKLNKITLPGAILTRDGKMRVTTVTCAIQMINFVNDIIHVLDSPYNTKGEEHEET